MCCMNINVTLGFWNYFANFKCWFKVQLSAEGRDKLFLDDY